MTTSVAPTAKERWSRHRVPLAIAALVVLAAVVMTWAQSQYNRGFLDPTSAEPGGSRALAELLREDGVDIHVSDDDADVFDRAPGGTVLVTEPDLLNADRMDSLADTGADIVLVGATTSVDHLSRDESRSGITASGVETDVVEPECDLGAAQLAGSALVGGVGYTISTDTGSADTEASGAGTSSSATSSRVTDQCYPIGDAFALTTLSLDGGTVTLLGSGEALTNRRLDEDGNAALALNLLGGRSELVWFQPQMAGGGDTAATDILPSGVWPVVGMLGVAGILAAVWRGRRMGRLVTEPLPVVVRASETAEGRGRLYRHGRDRAHSAAALRDATLTRCRTRLGLPRSTPDRDVAAVVADHLRRPAPEITALLAGDPPDNDTALVALADELDAVEAALHDDPLMRQNRTQTSSAPATPGGHGP